MSNPLVIQAAMVTPLMPDLSIDYSTLDRLIERLVSHDGIDLSILGSTGEGASAPLSFRSTFREAVMNRVNGRCKVYTGIINAIPSDTAEELRALQGLGLSGALIPPPFYYPISGLEIRSYFEDLADRSPVPLMLYNIPPLTKVSLPAEVVLQLASHPNIMGIKDSSRDFEYFLQLRHVLGDRDDFLVLTGTDTLIASSVRAGGDGTVCAIANLVPHWVRSTCQSALSHNARETLDEHSRLSQLAYLVRALGGVSAWKYGVRVLDGGTGLLFPPFKAIDDHTQAANQLKSFLASHRLVEL